MTPPNIPDSSSPDQIAIDQLIMATRKGDIARVEELLTQGIPIDGKAHLGLTALIFAAHNGNEKLVRLLINKGADLNMGDNDGYTPLIWAAVKNYPDIVRLLIQNGAAWDQKDKNGKLPRDYALDCNSFSAIQVLDDAPQILLKHQEERKSTALAAARNAYILKRDIPAPKPFDFKKKP